MVLASRRLSRHRTAVVPFTHPASPTRVRPSQTPVGERPGFDGPTHRAGRLSHRQVGEALGLDYWQTETFLKERGVPLNYSATDLEARNAGLDELPPRELRYDRADEVLEACFALWNGWEENATHATASWLRSARASTCSAT